MQFCQSLAWLGAILVLQVTADGVTYKATLSEADGGGSIKGYISATAGADGNGVKFTVDFEGLPSEGGPFPYHIHNDPVTNANCTSTGGHLDPAKIGDAFVCDPSQPQACQVGDLAGKYGKIESNPFHAEYTDNFVSFDQGSPNFFGDRSFVVHLANKTRIACANFEEVSDPTTTKYPTGSRTTGSGPTKTGEPGIPSSTTATQASGTAEPSVTLPTSTPSQVTSGAAASSVGIYVSIIALGFAVALSL